MDKIQLLEARVASLEGRLALAEAMIQHYHGEVATTDRGPSLMAMIMKMTARQFGTLCLVMAGKDNMEIGNALQCSESTAKTTARRAMLHIEVSTRSDCFSKWFDEWQLLDDEELRKVFGFDRSFGSSWQGQPEALKLVRGE